MIKELLLRTEFAEKAEVLSAAIERVGLTLETLDQLPRKSPRPCGEDVYAVVAAIRAAEQLPEEEKELLISPAALKLAEEFEIDLDQIEPTGSGGKIIKYDVQRFIEQGEPNDDT